MTPIEWAIQYEQCNLTIEPNLKYFRKLLISKWRDTLQRKILIWNKTSFCEIPFIWSEHIYFFGIWFEYEISKYEKKGVCVQCNSFKISFNASHPNQLKSFFQWKLQWTLDNFIEWGTTLSTASNDKEILW